MKIGLIVGLILSFATGWVVATHFPLPIALLIALPLGCLYGILGGMYDRTK